MLKHNQVRIIAGQWRSRRITFPNSDGLRPSGDRLREALFNWLMPWIDGCSVLDLYAGSGILSFEAVSRGAAGALMVEQSKAVAAQLRASCDQLKASNIQVHQARAQDFLATNQTAFDLIFVDPPFASTLLQPTLDTIAAGPHLNRRGLVYVECERRQSYSAPQHWERIKHKIQGDVSATLWQAQTA